MKNVISLLMAALVASVLASGCGKHKECSDAGTKKEECVEGKFETDAFKNKCAWLPNADSTDGKKGNCKRTQEAIDAVKATCEDGTVAKTNNDECAALIANQKEAAPGKTCVHDTSATAKASKCKFN